MSNDNIIVYCTEGNVIFDSNGKKSQGVQNKEKCSS